MTKRTMALAVAALFLAATAAACDTASSDGGGGGGTSDSTGGGADASSGGGDTTTGAGADDASTGGAMQDDASTGSGDGAGDASAGGGSGGTGGGEDEGSMGGGGADEDASTGGGEDPDDTSMGGPDDAGGGLTEDPAPTDGCLAGAFLDVSLAPGPGAGYPAPFVEATCAGDTMTVKANSIPHYTFVQVTPNALVAQDRTYDLPIDPQVADQPTEIPLLGYVGVAVNGCPFFGPNEGAQPSDSAFGDPVYNGITDDCLGHTANEYHFHALTVQCLGATSLVAEPWTNPTVPGDEPSPIVGFAADGFPIYGKHGCEDAECTAVIEYQSSWEQIADPTKDAWDSYAYVEKSGVEFLDECNGHFGPQGDYHYHSTEGFPYILGCFTGTPVGTAGAGGGDPGGGGPGGGGPGGGPTACTVDLDCANACADGYECGCETTPMGDKVCVASCDASGGCPEGFTCNQGDLCIPAGGPPGGGPGGGGPP